MTLSLRHVLFEGRHAVVEHHRGAGGAVVHPGIPRSSPRGADERPVCASRAASARPVDPGSFAAWVLSRGGLDPGAYRHACLERRVPACLRALHVKTAGEALRRLGDDSGLVEAALDALLIGVTAFYRDREVFEGIERHVVPAIVEARQKPRPTPGTCGASPDRCGADLSASAQEGRTRRSLDEGGPAPEQRATPVRVWSAGCSSGAELFSVGLLLAAAGVYDVELLGTDCRPSAIQEAEAARYQARELADLPGPLAARFRAEGGGLGPPRELQMRARWRVADACARVEDGPWDIVLCRNLSIYLTPAAGRALYQRLASVVRRGGFLVVGRAERLPQDLPFVGMTRCVYRHRGA